MERRAGSSIVAAPPRYDGEDCHEYVSSTICKCPYSPFFTLKSRVFTKGILLRSCNFSPIYAHFLVFGYTEYKGKQKEIFDAAINGM